ncbi:MAG: MATE family efflux transporter [Lachnospiraceae bacterium]|nr:MATE family efflux transporter [Lachnospiraceae bacterium]
MSKRHKYRNLLKTLITLSIPTIMEEVMSVLLQYVDTAMVGHLGEQATAAVSTTTTISWMVNGAVYAMGIAVLALISQAYGRGDYDTIQKVSKQAFFLTIICGVVIGGLAVALSPFVPIWMGADKSIRAEASRYFMIISLPMVFRAGNMIFSEAIRGTLDTKTPMLVNLVENVLNTVLNYIFIYMMDMGVTGAALGSAISYTVGGVAMYLVYRRKTELRWKYNELRWDNDTMKEICKIGLPAMGSDLTATLGYVVFAAMVSGMGTFIFAAHSIAVTAETIFYIPGYGLRASTSSLAGVALGEKNHEKLKIVCVLSIALTVGLMTLSGAILYFGAYPLMRVFTPSERVIDLGGQVLKMVAFSEPFFGLMVVIQGIFYGLGRTKEVFIVETIGMWGVRILFTHLCVHVWKLGLIAVWNCMIASNITKAVLLLVLLLIEYHKLFAGRGTNHDTV